MKRMQKVTDHRGTAIFALLRDPLLLPPSMRRRSGEQLFHVVRQKNMKKKQKSKIPQGRRIISWTQQAFWWRPKSPTVRDLLNLHVL